MINFLDFSFSSHLFTSPSINRSCGRLIPAPKPRPIHIESVVKQKQQLVKKNTVALALSVGDWFHTPERFQKSMNLQVSYKMAWYVHITLTCILPYMLNYIKTGSSSLLIIHRLLIIPNSTEMLCK